MYVLYWYVSNPSVGHDLISFLTVVIPGVIFCMLLSCAVGVSLCLRVCVFLVCVWCMYFILVLCVMLTAYAICCYVYSCYYYVYVLY